MCHEDDYARSLKEPSVRERRRAMLSLPHVLRLTEYVTHLRETANSYGGHGISVPNFDPLDGGVDAQVLFLFEKPGPMTGAEGRGRRPGSGFISRNNDDPTALATFNFIRQAGLKPAQIVIWNVVPWWDGTRDIANDDLLKGLQCVTELIPMLKQFRVIVLVGQKAQRAGLSSKPNGQSLLQIIRHP
ncbi:MAG: uracil-DNA glycosylase [Methyloceanibacter sp.]